MEIRRRLIKHLNLQNRSRQSYTYAMDGEKSFFDLPLELRELIYKEVLSDHSQGQELLYTCRNILSEAHKFLFQRRITFRGQSSLYRWLERVPQDLLQYVHEVLFELQDVDLTSVLSSNTTAEQPRRTRGFKIWGLYQSELVALNQAFARLPGVRVITIRAISGRQTHLYGQFLTGLLERIKVYYPGLKSFSLEGSMHNQSLEFLCSFRNLTSLTFDGYSTSGLVQTIEFLSSLRLKKVSIISLNHHSQNPPSHTTHSISFNSNILRAVNQTASLPATEHTNDSLDLPFLAPEILGQLYNHSTLSSLSLCLSNTPSEGNLETLKNFLTLNINMKELELSWPDLDPGIIQEYVSVSNSLKDLWVKASNMSAAINILNVVLASKEREMLRDLRRVVLMRDMEWGNGTGDENMVVPEYVGSSFC